MPKFNYKPEKETWDKVRLVFDIDGIICKDGATADYSKAEPYLEGIVQINKAYDDGFFIILSTARGMKKGKGNVLAAHYYAYSDTVRWLEKHGVKYHLLQLGKPSGDLYVDNNACYVDGSAGMRDWDANFWPMANYLKKLKAEEK